MLKYTIKRIFLAVITLFLICFITFFAMNAVPGGPFNGEKAKSAEVLRVLNARYGLDQPVLVQFKNYMVNLLHGDFGISLTTGRDIGKTISALNRNKWPDRVIIFFVTLFTAMPSFVLGSFLLLVFCIQLKIVPVWSTNNPNYVLPVIALSLSPMAYITRLTKTSMLDVLGQDYVRTARAKGVSPWKIIFVHSLRNALIPVITYVGPLTASILTGSLVVETIFTIGGLGSKFVDSITKRDYTMIMGTTIFLATLMVVMNLVSDLVYKLVDPRIKLD